MNQQEEQATKACEEKETCLCMGTGPQLTSLLRKLGPESARQHFRNARVEILKGMRELIDRRIEVLSQEHEKGTHVTVE